MKNKTPLLSVIIPTKNRYNVLIPVLSSICKNINDLKIEFVIQDNSSNNMQIIEFLSSFDDSRIKYFYINEDLDVVENFNNAIRNAIGKYILMIGDDDFNHPYIIDIMNIIDGKDIESIIYPRANYYWSDVVFPRETDFFESASIQVIRDCDLEFKERFSKVELENVLNEGGIYLFNLPAVYHGIVKKSILDKIFEKYGSYVLGPSPDMSLSIAVGLEIESYYFVNFPISVTGASYNSAAGMGRRGTHSKSLEDVPSWLPDDLSSNWDPLLPRLWNGFTIYAQSIYEVLKCYNVNKGINYKRLYDKILKDNFNDLIYLKEIKNFKDINIVERNLLIIKHSIYNYAKMIQTLFPVWVFNIIINNHPSFKKSKHIKNIKDIDESMKWMKSEHSNLFS